MALGRRVVVLLGRSMPVLLGRRLRASVGPLFVRLHVRRLWCHAYGLPRIAAGAVDVHLERYDEADAFVVDGGEDRVAGGEGEAVEVAQDRALHRLPGGGDDRHPADRGTARGARGGMDRGCRRAVRRCRYMDLDRRHRGDRLPPGTGRRALPLEFPLLFAAESRHRFPHEGVVADEDEVEDTGEGEADEDVDGDGGVPASTVSTSEMRHGRPSPARVSLR